MAFGGGAPRCSEYIDILKPGLLTDLKAALIRYEGYKGSLLESYKGVSSMFGTVYDILGKDDPVTMKIKSEMEQEMMPIKHLMRDPIILVSGQVNSGKSSLINEILGNSLVPVEELPCTSRIVRIKYSEVNYYQIFDKSGKPKDERRPFGKKIEKEVMKKEIKLRSSGCFEELVPHHDAEESVEIGVNADLLKSGIQIVDTPGMSENETLDKIVQECLDGVLQVLIYVIDANPSHRLTVSQ
jgi:GTP1/Obg family GTP-binding protein